MKCVVMSLGIAACLGSSFAMAETANLTLKLSGIERVIATEEGGDELYFSITEYSTKVHPRHYVVPAFPTHWLSDHLTGLKNILLWDRTLQENEAVTVLVSLVEGDAPPWNVDDLIGTVKLKAINKGNDVDTQWQIPNRELAEKVSGSDNSFVLTGDGGEYHIALNLTVNHAPASDKPVSKK